MKTEPFVTNAILITDDLRQAFPFRRGDFLMEVEGDSMVGDGILPGDLVLLRPGVEASEGDICAVQVRDKKSGCCGRVLKHLYRQTGKGTVTLRSSNSAFEDVVLPCGSVALLGVFRGLVRRAV